MSKKPIVIAIDGPVASGKGTLARNLGETLDYAVLDTGMLYRATGYLTLEDGGDPSKQEDAVPAAKKLSRLLDTGILNNVALRSDRVSDAASKVGTVPEVRLALLDLQRGFATTPPNNKAGAILDGRDIGTLVCPDADVKLFITAKPEVRAERRARQLHGDDWQEHYQYQLDETIKRDKRDSNRTVAPLKPADDALILDTSELGIGTVLKTAAEHIRATLA